MRNPSDPIVSHFKPQLSRAGPPAESRTQPRTPERSAATAERGPKRTQQWRRKRDGGESGATGRMDTTLLWAKSLRAWAAPPPHSPPPSLSQDAPCDAHSVEVRLRPAGRAKEKLRGCARHTRSKRTCGQGAKKMGAETRIQTHARHTRSKRKFAQAKRMGALGKFARACEAH
jgi:hypothetical protein